MAKLLPRRSCGFHSIHGAFKTGDNKTDWDVKKLMKALHQILHDNPARHANYTDITGSQQFPLSFCGRWRIEDEKVAIRAINIWESICQLCNFYQSLPKSKQPTSKSYMIVSCYLLPKIVLFWENCTSSLTPVVTFLTQYQSVKAMIPFLYDHLYHWTRYIVSNFIKPDVLELYK